MLANTIISTIVNTFEISRWNSNITCYDAFHFLWATLAIESVSYMDDASVLLIALT